MRCGLTRDTNIKRKRKREDDRHQYAMTEDGEWVHARDGIKGVPYYCDCPDHHKLKFVPPSGNKNKRHFTSFFAHYGNASCLGGGESMKHRLAKHRIRELASKLSFAVEICPDCGDATYFRSDGHTVRLEVQSIDKSLRHDCVAYNAHGTAVYALEVRHTHASSQDKIDSTRSNLGFAEFMVDDVLASTDGRLHNIEPAVRLDCHNCREFTAYLKKRKLERAEAVRAYNMQKYAATSEAMGLQHEAAEDAERLKNRQVDAMYVETSTNCADVDDKADFGIFFVDNSKVDNSADIFLKAFGSRLGNIDDIYPVDQQQYEEINQHVKQASIRYENTECVVNQLQPHAATMDGRDKNMVIRDVGSMSLMPCQKLVQLIVALTLLVGTDVEFAVRVFYALVFCKDDRYVAWKFKAFTTFIRLAISGALHVAGDPRHVVWRLCRLPAAVPVVL